MSDLMLSLAPEITDLTEVRAKSVRVSRPNFRNPAVDYHNVEASVREFRFRNLDPRLGEPQSLRQIDYTNGSSVEQTTTFKDTAETTVKLALSMTAGFRYKQELKGSVSIKKFLEVGGGHEWEFSLSSTTTAERSFTQKWEWELPIRVPARRRIVATALLSTLYVTPEFTADVDVLAKTNNYNTGTQVYVYENVAHGEWVRWDLQSWVFAYGASPRFTPVSADQVRYQAAGRIQGVYGKQVVINIKEYEIGGALTSVRDYAIDALAGTADLLGDDAGILLPTPAGEGEVSLPVAV
jgi:hypothetical protein